jgi:hypothetical protein
MRTGGYSATAKKGQNRRSGAANVSPSKPSDVNTWSPGPTICRNIDYTDLICRPTRDLLRERPTRSEELFQGILWYITEKSDWKYNLWQIQLGYKEMTRGSDPSNILHCNTEAEFRTPSSPGQFLQITFLKIRVQPYAYAVRFPVPARKPPHGTAFTLRGQVAADEWPVLDERTFPFIGNPGTRIFFVDTDRYFTQFRLVPEQGVEFALVAFDLHGTVEPIDFGTFREPSIYCRDLMPEPL